MSRSVQQFTVFVSSPGDVDAERKLALKAIEELNAEAQFAGRAHLRATAWDAEGVGLPMDARRPPQEEIDKWLGHAKEADVVLVIFWSRLGTPFEYSDGRQERSGTVAELMNAWNAEGGPPIWVYYCTRDPEIDYGDAAKAKQAFAAHQETQRFVKDGVIKGRTDYAEPQEFVERYKNALRTWLVDAIGVAMAPTAAATRSPDTADIELSQLLLENLAHQFDVENPSAPRRRLLEFLKAKADEYKDLKARMAAIDDAEGHLDNQLAAATGAIEAGDFAGADAILAAAEAVQLQDHALVQRRRLSDIRETRAQAALFAGDADTAFAHFAKAADLLQPLDATEGFDRRVVGIARLRDHGVRYGGSALAHAIDLCRRNLSLVTATSDVRRWANGQMWLGIALQEQGARTAGDDGARRLAEAVDADRAALRVWTEADHPLDWATTQNNLGNALRNQGARTAGDDGARRLAEAVDAYRAALHVRTEADHPLDWAGTQNNLGNALRDQGARTAGDDGARRLAEAVDAYRAALRVRTEADHPLDWAMTQNNLGAALQEQGARAAGDDGARRLAEAVATYRAALRVWTEADHPLQWAMTQENLGLAFESWAAAAPGDAAAHLQAALAAVDAALTVFDPAHLTYNFEKASRLRDRIAAKRAAPDADGPPPS